MARKKAAKTSPKSSPKKPAKRSPKSRAAPVKPPNATEVAQLVREKVSKKGALAIAELSSEENRSRVSDWISTQSLEIDALLRCPGLPAGRIVEAVGKAHSGKTTFAAHVCAEVQRRGGVAYYRDREETLDKEYIRAVGVDPDRLQMVIPAGPALEDDVEAIEAIVDVLAPIDLLSVIVYDSLGGASTRADLKKKFGQRQPGSAASGIREMCRRLVAKLAGSRVLLLLINHTYQNIGQLFGNPEKPYGGEGLSYFASIILHFRRRGMLSDGVDGSLSAVTVWKSKIAPVAGQKRDIALARGQGIDNVYAIYQALSEAKLIAKGGSWSSVRLSEDEELKWQGGWPGLYSKLAGDDAAFGRLADAFHALQPAAVPLLPPRPDLLGEGLAAMTAGVPKTEEGLRSEDTDAHV